jgi:DNA replication protein DnaC
MSKIDETLKKIAGGMPSGNPQSGDDLPARGKYDLPGDPACPICQGVGYLRTDRPVDHPDFGKLEICSCRQGQVSRQIRQRLFSLSNLHELSHLTFDNFKPRGRVGLAPVQGDSLERAYNQAHQFAQKLEGWLLLQGG